MSGGEGVENYMSDAPIDIAPAPNFGNPVKPFKGRALPLQSLVAFLDHTWNSKWTSSAGYSQLAVSNTVLQRPDDFHRGQYAIANLLYTPTSTLCTVSKRSGHDAPILATAFMRTTIEFSLASDTTLPRKSEV
jgi:hypothetical protein